MIGKRIRLGPLFDAVADPIRADIDTDAAGVFCCGLRIVSLDGASSDIPTGATSIGPAAVAPMAAVT
jgi:hypothetical protein